MSVMLNVFIIDQSIIVRFGIRYFLEESFEKVLISDFCSVAELQNTVQTPNLIFLGVSDNNVGLQTLGVVRKLYKNSRIAIYNTDVRHQNGLRYLEHGAQAYLSKQIDVNAFRRSIESVISGKLYIDSADRSLILKALVEKQTDFYPARSPRKSALTPRQSEIAALYAQGLSTSLVAMKLGLKPSTVSTVKSVIYYKLNVENIIQLSQLFSALR